MDVDANDAAFILGRGGQTKQKISRVSGAELDLNERENKITIYGTRKQRKAARDYIGYIMMQRTGEVKIDLDEERDDITVVKVPDDCVAFCMGRGGQTLRSMEQEWGSLMFFAKSAAGSNDGKEMLMIFGPLRARRGAEMKVMSAVEHKRPGTFVRDGELFMQKRVRGDEVDGSWDVDWLLLEGDEFSYALGAGGSTRKKLAAASGCILEYVGNMACFCGYKRERRRAKDYLKWLLKQRDGPVSVDYEERDDVTVVRVPQGSVGFITGHRGESLRSIERETNTFCFINEASRGGKEEELLIFGDSDHARRRAKHIVKDKIDDHRDMGGRGGGGYGGGYGGGGRYDDRYDRRDRDYDRRDRDYDRRDRDRDRDRRDRRRSYSRSRSRSRDRRRDRY